MSALLQIPDGVSAPDSWDDSERIRVARQAVAAIPAQQAELQRLPSPEPSTLSMPSQLPSLNAPAPNVVQQPTPTPQSLMQESVLRNQNDLKRLQTEGNTYTRIAHPIDPATGLPSTQSPSLLRRLGGIAGAIGDAAFSSILPGAASITPGTTLNRFAQMRQDQNHINAGLQGQDEAAQAQQRQALATQEQAKALNLLHPKTGQLLYDKNGDPIGYQDQMGKYYGPDDPNIDPGVKEVLDSAQAKRPKTPFDLWQQDNPKGTADQYLALSKPEKDATLQQQYLDAMTSGDNNKARAILQVIHDTSTQPKIDIHNAAAQTLGGLPPAVPGQPLDPQVQAIIDGRAPLPQTRSKQGMALAHAVMAADPTYDASRYNTYQAMQKEATVGKTGQAINSLTTIQEHINRALQNMPANGSMRPLNYLENKGSELFGGNPTGKFEVDATGIAGEWSKLVSGGVASQGEQDHVQKLLDPNASPAKMKDNLAEVKAMTDGKLLGIQKQIQSAQHPGFGNNFPTSLPSPSGKFSVTAPDGSVHPFETQAQADKFKKLAGIQ